MKNSEPEMTLPVVCSIGIGSGTFDGKRDLPYWPTHSFEEYLEVLLKANIPARLMTDEYSRLSRSMESTK